MSKTEDLYKKHHKVIKDATEAIHSRKFFAAYPEPPSKRIYGEEAAPRGLEAYKAQVGQPYAGLLQENDGYLAANENSPYTLEDLGISYPYSNDTADYLRRSLEAAPAWRKLSPRDRAGLLVESLEGIKERFFEMAHATQHTTGQSFVMSFQASGPHSNDRALEAIALGLTELTRFPESVDWEKPMGKFDVKLKKYYKNVPLGVNLLIGCSTFPVWNTIPGLYAALITGNTAICKPHPGSIYPIAIVVDEIQKALQANGIDPHTVQLAPDTYDKMITKELAEDPAVKLIDYTGGNIFGNYIESLPGKRTFTEKAGINSIVLHGVKNVREAFGNIAFSLSLYSGQMCTCPQNIFVPKDGIDTLDEDGNVVHISYEETVGHIVKALKWLTTHEKMGPGTLGAIQSQVTFDRVKEAEAMGYKVLLESQQISNPEFPNARIATPALIEVPADKKDVYEREMFGPIVFVIQTEDIASAVRTARELATNHGAITFSAYTLEDEMMDYMVEEMSQSFTSIAFNFVGPIWVNQSAGFSDFHVTGGNPAGNASLTDPEFILGRFEIVGIRVHP